MLCGWTEKSGKEGMPGINIRNTISLVNLLENFSKVKFSFRVVLHVEIWFKCTHKGVSITCQK